MAFWGALKASYSSFSTDTQANLDRLSAFVVFLFFLGWAAAGCKKPEPAHPAPAKIHAITRELAAAAKWAAPTGSEIRVAFQAPGANGGVTDRLNITLFSTGADSATRTQVAKLQQSLSSVATRHGLTEEPSESREGVLLFFLKSGVRTHAIHIHAGAKASLHAGGPSGPPSAPRLAIIADDLGSDRAAAEAIFALPYPLTISILPNHEHSTEIASEAHRRGYQVMLHLPMQSIANETPEAQELRPGMPATEVSALVEQFLQSVPGVVGINNHQGSQATSDPELMDELMPVLRDRHLFYVDSRTTAATVAFDTAQSFGVRSAFRNVPFLDDVAEVAAVRKQLELALRGAREKGEAIAIGHPHPATLQALREILPRAQAQGIRLVFVSELVH
ncbi:MAG: hypothetical protein DMG44_01065 [Acidobacteria bacterium]|nr:MAG: hypothetical protein DMG44_01065 [Acidobacteriota bacterium]